MEVQKNELIIIFCLKIFEEMTVLIELQEHAGDNEYQEVKYFIKIFYRWKANRPIIRFVSRSILYFLLLYFALLKRPLQ